MRIRLLSLWQPWASLVVHGHKQIETRSYSTKYRGLFLIHATQDSSNMQPVADLPYFTEAIEAMGGKTALPLGAIVGAAILYNVMPTDYIKLLAAKQQVSMLPTFHKAEINNWDKELTFGDYSPNRYGWLLKEAKAFPKPIPCEGRQNFSTVDYTQELQLQVRKLYPNHIQYVPINLL